MTRRALVLGGGGFVASAWEVGLISGVAATGVDLRDYDMFLGTSSGARVALHLASGTGLDELFHQQLGPRCVILSKGITRARGKPVSLPPKTYGNRWLMARRRAAASSKRPGRDDTWSGCPDVASGAPN